MDELLVATNLSKKYGSTLGLAETDLTLPRGKIIGLLGPNGSGKTTLIKLIAGLLAPTTGTITVCGKPIGPETKAIVSYLPDRDYFDPGLKITTLLDYFQDFYKDFDRERAEAMLTGLGISLKKRFNTLSKGTREKVQLSLVMSRRAKLYLLDEPIAGVDPAARDFILHTIISNYDPEATVLISTHLIADVEPVLQEYIFVNQGHIIRQGSVADIYQEEGKSLDELFREVFRCLPPC